MGKKKNKNTKNNKHRQQRTNDTYEIQTPNDVIGWTLEEVLSWAKDFGLDKDDVGVLKREKVDGKGLIGLTYDRLVNAPFSLAGGPASKIDEALRKLRPADKSPPSESSSGSPSSQVSSEVYASLLKELESKKKALESTTKELDLARKRISYSDDDIWETKSASSGSSSSRSGSQFRKKLISYYGEEKCMLTGIAATGRALTAGHIWRASQNKNAALNKFGLTTKDVESPRNGLLLLTTIEDAFDTKQLCFFYDFTAKQLRLKLLDPSLRNATYHQGRPFSELEGRALDLFGRPLSEGPFRRLLASHCQASYANAFSEEWIDQPQFEEFEDFSHLSEKAIENDE